MLSCDDAFDGLGLGVGAWGFGVWGLLTIPENSWGLGVWSLGFPDHVQNQDRGHFTLEFCEWWADKVSATLPAYPLTRTLTWSCPHRGAGHAGARAGGDPKPRGAA